MYRPPHFQLNDPDAARALIAAYPLALLVSQSAGRLLATHVPMILDPAQPDRLIGHVARPNPHHQNAPEGEALAVFTGADAYVSPGFYASKAEHGRVVPTWNYASVHVRGRLSFTDDAAEKLRIVTRLTAAMEQREAKPWAVSDAPPDYIDAMLRGIVGLTLTIATIEAAMKASQNKPADDISGVTLGLGARADAPSRAMAELVARYRPPEG